MRHAGSAFRFLGSDSLSKSGDDSISEHIRKVVGLPARINRIKIGVVCLGEGGVIEIES